MLTVEHVENVDFFKTDPPKSIANKIITCNLSDLSSMGATPYAYTLSLCLPKNISPNWLKKFTKKSLYEWFNNTRSDYEERDFCKIYIEYPRNELIKRINF